VHARAALAPVAGLRVNSDAVNFPNEETGKISMEAADCLQHGDNCLEKLTTPRNIAFDRFPSRPAYFNATDAFASSIPQRNLHTVALERVRESALTSHWAGGYIYSSNFFGAARQEGSTSLCIAHIRRSIHNGSLFLKFSKVLLSF
jgi:hypothetical protein